MANCNTPSIRARLCGPNLCIKHPSEEGVVEIFRNFIYIGYMKPKNIGSNAQVPIVQTIGFNSQSISLFPLHIAKRLVADLREKLSHVGNCEEPPIPHCAPVLWLIEQLNATITAAEKMDKQLTAIHYARLNQGKKKLDRNFGYTR